MTLPFTKISLDFELLSNYAVNIVVVILEIWLYNNDFMVRGRLSELVFENRHGKVQV